MRPPEAKNLRRRDITLAKDCDGREIVVMFVEGKGQSRKLVAPKSVGDYLDRVRELSWTCNGLILVTCLSSCHLSFESQRANAAQI
jgi:hypothetical protein